MKTDKLTSTFIDLRGKLHSIALGMLRSDEDAKDALQDAWLRLSGQPSAADFSEAEARNKLVTVLRNLCIDRLRRQRLLALDAAPQLADMPDAAADRSREDELAEIERLLRRGLTPLQRTIFTLVADDGLDYEAIALRLGMTVEAVRMNMSRARKKIRETYKSLDR